MSLNPMLAAIQETVEDQSDCPSQASASSVSEDASTADRLDEILVAYLRAEDAGLRPNRQQLFEQHPDLAEELKEFFRNQDEINDLTKPLRPAQSLAEFFDTQPVDAAAIQLAPTILYEPHGHAAGRAVETDSDLAFWSLPGSQLRYFGSYELLNQIAHGGMGVVYKARQLKLNRIVAVKMILAGHFASDDEVRRFRAEAEAAAQLQHPNIVAIHEVGECHGQHYFSMDYVAGTSLSAMLNGHPLPPKQATEYVRAIAEAIHYAHSKGVLHCDLKPSNVLMEGFDVQGIESKPISRPRSSPVNHHHQPFTPKLTDFGLAKRVSVSAGNASEDSASNRTEVTMTGAIVGTPSYMPPEQASGRHVEFGPTSDVYSLGAILYESLTGRPPFRAETPVDTLLQVLNSEPAPPRLLNPLVPRDLETICLKCLSKEPQQRYATAQDLADELQRFLNDEPIQARPISLVARLARWCSRNRAIASLAAVVIVCLIALPIGATIAAIHLRYERNAALTNLDRALRAEADATEKLWGSYLAQARAGRWSGRTGRRFDSLDAIAKAAAIRPSEELRDEAIACMALPDMRVAKQWKIKTRPPGGVTVSFDSTLERYATYDETGEIQLHDASNHTELLRLPGPGNTVEWTLRFSADGRWLVAKYQDGSLRLWDLDRRETTLELPSGASLGAVNFSPDSQRIAIGDNNGSIHIHNTESGAELKRFTSLTQPYALVFHPHDNKLAISSHTNSQAVIVDANTGTVLKPLPHPAGVRGMSWRPDGSLLATSCANGAVFVWEISTGRSKSLDGHGVTVTHVTFNHAGNLLASYGWDGATRLWDPVSGKRHVRVAGEFIAFSRFSPDDRWLPFKVSSDEVGLWEIATADECRTLGKGTPSSFSPNGRLLAATDDQGTKVWDVSTGHVAAVVPDQHAVSAHFLGDDSNILISARNRLSSWSLEPSAPDQSGALQVGANTEILPERIAVLGPASVTPNARWIVAEQLAARSLILIDRDQLTHRLFEGTHDSRNLFLAISPHARWIASGTWKGTGVKVWDAAAGRALIDLPVEGNCNVAFSPDEKWLVTGSGEEYRFWEVGSWKPRHSVARDHAGDIWGRMTFSSDGHTLAVSIAREGGLQLLDPHDGHTIAKLEAPSQQTPGCFSPDGQHLAVAAEGGVLQVWNLKLVREQLAKMNLDWPSP